MDALDIFEEHPYKDMLPINLPKRDNNSPSQQMLKIVVVLLQNGWCCTKNTNLLVA